MSSIIIALILVVIVISISSIFIFMNHREIKRKKEKLLARFSKLGAHYNMSFSSREILRDKIIGLDGSQRKLLILKLDHDQYNWHTISLEDVSACKVRKEYSSINVGDLKNKRIEEYLNLIALQFDFKDNAQPVSLSFYENIIDSVYQMKELETKAKDWEVLLSKMLTKPAKESA